MQLLLDVVPMKVPAQQLVEAAVALSEVLSQALLHSIFEEEFFSFLKSDEVRSFVTSFEDRHLLNGKIGRIRADTIILWGEHDSLTPAKWIDQWLSALPADGKKTGIVIRGSGHSPQIEKPGVLIALFTQIFMGRTPTNLALLPLWKVVKKTA